MESSESGKKIIAEKYRARSIPPKVIDGFIPLVNNVLPQDNGTFNMGEVDQDNPVTLEHYCLHQYLRHEPGIRAVRSAAQEWSLVER